MDRMLEIKERVAKYGLSRMAKDEVAWWNARDELNFNAYDDLQYLLQEHTRITAEIEAMKAERDRFKARAEAAERDLTMLSDRFKICLTCKHNHGGGIDDCHKYDCDEKNLYEWRGPGEEGDTHDTLTK